ncbi:hypothetical protein IW148_003954 [Coemansia sp. RSA 1199]|nr:hypothetical protein IW148_003954 [Coemansia sp. RSA 1199]
MLWENACSAWRWASNTEPAQHLPPQYPSLARGYLHGPRDTKQLVSACSQQQHTLTLTDALPVFSAIGTRRQISDLLRAMPSMVFCKHSRSATSNIVIELHRSLPSIWQYSTNSGEKSTIRRMAALAVGCWQLLIARLFSQERKLVVRAECSEPTTSAQPLVSIRAPQGIMLSEVAVLLERSVGLDSIDVTRDKALNIRVMGRSRSLLWIEHEGNEDTDPLFLLPPYQPYENDLPPAYTLCERT